MGIKTKDLMLAAKAKDPRNAIKALAIQSLPPLQRELYREISQHSDTTAADLAKSLDISIYSAGNQLKALTDLGLIIRVDHTGPHGLYYRYQINRFWSVY